MTTTTHDGDSTFRVTCSEHGSIGHAADRTEAFRIIDSHNRQHGTRYAR